MSFSVSVVMGQEYLPSRLGIASGVTLGFAIGVGGIAAALLGVLADHSGLETVMWTIALLPLVGLALALTLPLTAHERPQHRRAAALGCLPTSFVMQRTRTFSWSDPLETAQAAAELPGIDAIRAIAAGELPPPPIAELLDFEITLVEPGRVIFAITPAEWMYNPIGSVHGGVAATLLDSSLGCAIHTELAAGPALHDADLQVRYVRAMSADSGRVLADSRVVHVGRKLATAEGRLYAEDGEKLFAHATTSCLIL